MAMAEREKLKLKLQLRARAQAKALETTQANAPYADIPSAVEDMGVGLVSGVNKGVTGVPGLPGDIQAILRMVDDKLGGVMPDVIPNMPTSEQTSKTAMDLLEQLPGGKPLPEPKGKVGEYGERIGEFFGGSPLSKSLSTARGAGTTLGAAVGSKAGEDATDSWWGSMLGTILGAKAGTVAQGGKSTTKALLNEKRLNGVRLKNVDIADYREHVRENKDDLYKELRDNAIGLDKAEYADTIKEVITELKDNGMGSYGSPGSKRLLKYMIDKGSGKDPLSFAQVESIRVKAGNMAKSPDPEDRLAAKIVAEKIDEYFTKSAAIGNPNYPNFEEAIDKARTMGRSHIISRDIQEARRSGSFSKSGEVIGELGKLRNLAMSKKGKNLYEPEVEALRKVTNPSLVRKAGETLSGNIPKLGGLLSLLGGDGINLYGFLASLGSVAGGKGLEKFSDMNSRKAMNDFEKVVLAGKYAQARAMKTVKKRTKHDPKRIRDATVLGIVNSPYEDKE
jgi:hypothetical protein